MQTVSRRAIYFGNVLGANCPCSMKTKRYARPIVQNYALTPLVFRNSTIVRNSFLTAWVCMIVTAGFAQGM